MYCLVEIIFNPVISKNIAPLRLTLTWVLVFLYLATLILAQWAEAMGRPVWAGSQDWALFPLFCIIPVRACPSQWLTSPVCPMRSWSRYSSEMSLAFLPALGSCLLLPIFRSACANCSHEHTACSHRTEPSRRGMAFHSQTVEEHGETRLWRHKRKGWQRFLLWLDIHKLPFLPWYQPEDWCEPSA